MLRLAPALALCLIAATSTAAPGDLLFEDRFDSGGSCRALAPFWTTSNASFSGTSTQTSSSPGCALFTRGGVVTTESVAIDLSGAVGVELRLWVRVGHDAFSENPDNGENFAIEYRDSSGFWLQLDELPGNSTPGQIFNLSFDLPAGALHPGFRLRFRQIAGSGASFDYWHVDDVILEETGVAPPPPASSNLGAGTCDDFESGFGNWNTTSPTASGVNADTAGSGASSMFLRHTSVTTTALPFDSAAVARLDLWVRRGADAFSEDPDTNENLVVQYRNSSGGWVTLETFPGNGTPGQILTRQYTLPAAARHAAFSIRFTLTGGSGSDFDYWHVDDVCLVAGTPDLQIRKSVATEQDPVNGNSGAFSIPGAWMVYTVEVENQGIGEPDTNTVVIVDDLPAGTTLFTGDFDGAGSPLEFQDGSPSSGLSLPFTTLSDGSDGVHFYDSGGGSVVPNGGFDPTVRRVEVVFPGTMAGTGAGGNPTFRLTYRVLVE